MAPAQVILWVKGTQKASLITCLINTLGLPCPFLVGNLEDMACPTTKQLEPVDPGALLTQEKVRLFGTWLPLEGFDCDPVGRKNF